MSEATEPVDSAEPAEPTAGTAAFGNPSTSDATASADAVYAEDLTEDDHLHSELDGSFDEEELAQRLAFSDEVEADGDPEDSDDSTEEGSRSWLTRLSSGLGSGMASTGKFIWDIPGNLAMARSGNPQLRRDTNTTPLGARQVSHGYADDLWQARPPIHRPYPVVLIHGTISSKNVWQNLVLRLRADDFVVFCPDYGVHGTQDIPTSANDVGAYIEQVLAATGAPQVDIVGHSQGGLLARYWINELDGEDYVHHLISLGSPHHGTSLLGLLGGLLTSETTQRMAASTVRKIMGPAGMQQVVGSPLLETLAASEDTRPDILYTSYATLNDTTIVPHDQAFLKGKGLRTDGSPRVKNLYLQDVGIQRCRHEELPTSSRVQEIVHQTLLDGLDTEVDDSADDAVDDSTRDNER
ncbi:esterase/lipase family protein [Corynebacterium urogenitale]